MIHIKVYTFRTCPFIKDIETLFGEVLVFGKLNEDFKKFAVELRKEKPEFILGIAKLPRRYKRSKFEVAAVNKFHRTKRISLSGNSSYDLFTPDVTGTDFRIARKNDYSFCNWTMYKISEFVTNEKLPSKVMFVHLNADDLGVLKEIVGRLVK